MDLMIPKTQGINYLGSKLQLLPYILNLVEKLDVKTVLDGFSGTTRVSQALAKSGYQVVSNDISEWSYIFGLCYLKNKKQPSEYEELIAHLNSIKGYDGWFAEHYGGHDYLGKAVQSDGTKKPWQMKNARKLDGIRDEIDRLNLPEIDRAVALTSLVLALDQVSSTFCHFSSYRSNWTKQSYSDLLLTVPNVIVNKHDNTVVKGDIFDVIKNHPVDLAYLDPPYGVTNEKYIAPGVRYAGFYHIWATVCKNDRPKVFGVTNRREDSSDKLAKSVFEATGKAKDGQFIATNAIEKLIREVNAKHIVFSYNSTGRASLEDLIAVMNKYGTVESMLNIDYRKNTMAGMGWTDDWHAARDSDKRLKEYIFLIKKDCPT